MKKYLLSRSSREDSIPFDQCSCLDTQADMSFEPVTKQIFKYSDSIYWFLALYKFIQFIQI